MTASSPAPVNALTAYLVAVLGALVCAYTVLGSLPNFGTVNDLPEYYAGATMLLHGQASQIYVMPAIFQQEKALFPQLTRGIGLFVPPLSVFFLAPIALMPPAVALYLWQLVLAVALGAALWLLVRQHGLNRHEALWLVGLVLLSGPAVESLRVGQLSPLMLLALVASCGLAREQPAHDIAAGKRKLGARDIASVAAGLLIDVLVFKPQQLIPLLFYMGLAGWKKVVMPAVVALIFLFACAHVVFGSAGLGSYALAVTDPANLQLMQPQLNPTVRGQVMRFVGVQSLLPAIAGGACLIAAFCVIGLLAVRQRGRQRIKPIMLAAVMPLVLCTSLHCHDYDLLLFVPGLVVLSKSKLWRAWPGWLKAAVMLGMAAFLIPFYSDIHYGYLLRGGQINIHFWLLASFACLLVWSAFTRPDDFGPAAMSEGPQAAVDAAEPPQL